MIEWMILLVISHQLHSVLMHHSAIFILRTESYKTIAMHCRQKTICISASFSPFFMILIVYNSQEAHLSNGIRTRKNGYVLAEIWSAQAESKKHCNSFVRHCISYNGLNAKPELPCVSRLRYIILATPHYILTAYSRACAESLPV